MNRRDEALEQAREQLSEVDRDRLVVKAVKQLEQLDRDLRKQVEHFRDWYSLYFPELDQEIEDDQRFVETVAGNADRENLDSFSSLAENSKGAELRQEDLEILEKTAEALAGQFENRGSLEDYVTRLCEQEMPNLTTLLEPLLAAKLVALAGSLEDLAKSPASTIQMLGAEKALFRHLSGGGSAPKHGVLFEHRFVRTLPESERGKMARFLANKAAIAARMDQYGEKQQGKELREEAQEKYEELKEG